jgi:hypothetical protein
VAAAAAEPRWWSYLALFMALFGVMFANYVAEGLFWSFGDAVLSGRC